MRNWLLRWFSRQDEPAVVRHALPQARIRPAPIRAAEPPAADPASAHLSEDEREFLAGLVDPLPREALDLSSADDRLFLAGIQKRWHARRLDLPVLPAAAIRLTGLLRAGDAPLEKFVDLVESDSALSVEVLKAANSAFYAHGQTVKSLHDAVLRIGLQRLGSLLVMAQLTTKVMKGSAVQRKAALLMEMVPPLSHVAEALARHGEDDDLAGIRATLLHVEHMVILGAVSDVSRDHKLTIAPSVAALLQAFAQFGGEIRHAVATAWDLQGILLVTPEVAEEYAGFRRAVVCRWLGEPLPRLPGIEPSRLAHVMSQVPAPAPR